MPKIVSSIKIKSSPEVTFRVVSDFLSFPTMMPSIKKVVRQSGDESDHVTAWELDIEGADINWIQRSKVNSQSKIISFDMISGDYSSYHGEWLVKKDGLDSILYLQVNIDWGIPSFEKIIGGVLEEKTKRIIRGMLVAIKLHTQKNYSPNRGLKSQQRNQGKNQSSLSKRKFAFMIHPLDINLVSIAFNEPNILTKKYSLIKKAFEWLPSFQCSKVTGVEDVNGNEIDGELIYLSLLPEQILSLNDKTVVKKAIEAGLIAQSRGATVLGLGAYAAQIGKKGVLISRALNIPVTTGTHYTIYIAIKSVLDACEQCAISLKDARLAVVGATGAIGRICAQFFVDKVETLILVGRNISALEKLKEELSAYDSANISIETDAKKIIRYSDISILSTTTPDPIIDLKELTPGSIICDISRPRNVSNVYKLERADILIIDGGVVRPPGNNVDFNFYFGLPKGLAYACMAETMIIAMEQINEHFSIGGSVELAKVLKIGQLGDKHGFKLAKIMSFDKEADIQAFKKSLRPKNIQSSK